MNSSIFRNKIRAEIGALMYHSVELKMQWWHMFSDCSLPRFISALRCMCLYNEYFSALECITRSFQNTEFYGKEL